MSNSNHRVSIKRQMTLLIFSLMLAITGAMPASATVSNTIEQNLMGEQQSTLLLAGKKGGPHKGGPHKGEPSKGEPSKGGHSTEKSPSKRGKHEKGEARRHQDQVVNPERKEHDDYKKRGGKLGLDAWKREGQPRRDK